MSDSIVLLDSSSTSLTVSWPEMPGTVRYVLQYRKAGNSDDVDGESFETLSDKLTSTQARKRNLEDSSGSGFFFRVASLSADENTSDVKNWVSHAEPFFLLKDEGQRMAAPRVSHSGSHEAVVVSWDAVDGASGYELQMRENNGGVAWETIASSLSGTEVRKKNLGSTRGYQFRVRSAGTDIPFSPPSDPFVALGLSNAMKRLFGSLENGKLLLPDQQQKKNLVPLSQALGGKEFILLYASAHWCGPCRQFTPALANWYRSASKYAQVVFLSCDHDEKGFNSYYAGMPWAAVPFDDDAREELLAYIKVTGIPRLVVLDQKTGRIVENNAVGKPLDIQQWRKLAS